jgi:hypothetical protein
MYFACSSLIRWIISSAVSSLAPFIAIPLVRDFPPLKLLGPADAVEKFLSNWQQRQQGKAELKDETDQHAAQAKAREAAHYAAPRSDDWNSVVDRLP